MIRLCIIPCGKRKIWDKNPNIGPTTAKSAYMGSFTKKCKEYAIKYYPKSWCILSAKYGFLFPNDIIPGPYDVSFNNKDSKQISVKELSFLANEKALYKYEKIVILGGKNYIEIAKKVFAKKEINIPLKDCKGIGYMMSKLNESIKSGKKL